MDAIWGAETGAVEWVQGWGSWLEPIMLAVTMLGSKTLLIAVLPLVFWSVHARLGARLTVVLLGSATVNGVLKSVGHGARPYWYDPGVRPLSTESSFGIPSGHAQTAVTLWGYLAAIAARPRVWAAALVLIALICLSRIYLGVHFFTDILGGLAVGALLLWLALRYERRAVAWWRSRTLVVQMALAVGLSAAGPLLVALAQATLWSDWTTPEAWIGPVPPDPDAGALAEAASLSGALLGVLVGFTLLDRRGWYSADGSLITRAARYITGITGVVLIFVVVSLAFPASATAAAEYTTFLGATLWASFGAPELFIRMRMADREREGSEEPAATAPPS